MIYGDPIVITGDRRLEKGTSAEWLVVVTLVYSRHALAGHHEVKGQYRGIIVRDGWIPYRGGRSHRTNI